MLLIVDCRASPVRKELESPKTGCEVAVEAVAGADGASAGVGTGAGAADVVAGMGVGVGFGCYTVEAG